VNRKLSHGKQWNQEFNAGYAGQPWLIEERDACGVGFLADQKGRRSHELIRQALGALTCVEHRGGCSADQDSGDGAGLLSAIPWDLFSDWLAEQGVATSAVGHIGVGMAFLPTQAEAASSVRQVVEQVVVAEGLKLIGWRSVPVKPEVLGPQALENQPLIEQLFVQADTLSGDELERS